MPFLFDIFFTYISNAKPFPSFPSEDPLFTTPTPAPQPTHSLFLALAFPSTGAQNLHRTKDLLPVMTNQAILLYTFT